jgi:hypothetical protein
MTNKMPPVVTFTCSYNERYFSDQRKTCSKVIEVSLEKGDEQVVVCPRCRTPYEVWVRQSRHTRSRKHKSISENEVRSYNMRLYRLDGREELITFESDLIEPQLDAKSGDSLVLVFGGNYDASRLPRPIEVGGAQWEFRHLSKDHPLRQDIEKGYEEAVENKRANRAWWVANSWSRAGLTSITNNTTGQKVDFGGGPRAEIEADTVDSAVLSEPSELHALVEEIRSEPPPQWLTNMRQREQDARAGRLFWRIVISGAAIGCLAYIYSTF